MKAYFILLPKMNETDGVSFVGTPSKKTQKRFGPQKRPKKSATQPRNNKSLWVQAKVDEVIKSHLKQVTSALFAGMQKERTWKQGLNGGVVAPSWFERQRDAITARRPDISWRVTRFVLIRNLMYPLSIKLPTKKKTKK